MIMTDNANNGTAIRLETATRGSYMVNRVFGSDEQRHRLSEMGILEGTCVQVLNCSCNGMIVIKVGDSRLALAKGMSECILVDLPFCS